MRAERFERGLILTLAVLLTVVIAAGSLYGFGFFFIPIALLAFLAWGMYFVIRRVPSRNELAIHEPTISERFADGQPLRRTEEHEADVADERQGLAREQAASEEAERAEQARPSPREPIGPPPNVPFP